MIAYEVCIHRAGPLRGIHWPVTVLLKAVRNRLEGTVQPGAVRNRPYGTVWSRLDAAQSRPDTARNSAVERSERNKLHAYYMLTTCSVPQFCHVQDEHGK